MAIIITPVGVLRVGADTFVLTADDEEPVHLDDVPRAGLQDIASSLGLNSKASDLGLRTSINAVLQNEDEDAVLWLDKPEMRHDLHVDTDDAERADEGPDIDGDDDIDGDTDTDDGDVSDGNDGEDESDGGDAESDGDGDESEGDESDSEDESEGDGDGEGKGQAPPIDFHVRDQESQEEGWLPAEQIAKSLADFVLEQIKVQDRPTEPQVPQPKLERKRGELSDEQRKRLRDNGRMYHEREPEVVAALMGGQHVFLYGPPGTGKSQMGVRYAELAGNGMHIVSCHPHLTASALVGYTTPEGLKKGPLMLSAEQGATFIGDELDNTGPGVHAMFNSTMANGIIQVQDIIVHVPDTWRFVGTANTMGQGATSDFVGRQRLDAATLDRVASFFIGTDTVLEHNLVVAMGLPEDLQREWLAIVYRMRHNVDVHGIKTFVSMRTTLAGAKQLMIQRTPAWKRAGYQVLEPMDIARMRVLAKLPKDQALKVLD